MGSQKHHSTELTVQSPCSQEPREKMRISQSKGTILKRKEREITMLKKEPAGSVKVQQEAAEHRKGQSMLEARTPQQRE